MNEQANDMILDDDFLAAEDISEDTTLDGTQTEAEPEETTEATQETGTDKTTDTPTDPTPEGEAEKQAPVEDPDADLPEKITIKHLKGDMDIPKTEIRERLRKGVDYDRVRGQRDAAVQQLEAANQWRQQHENAVSTLEAVAQRTGKDLDTVVRELRVNLHRGNGATQAEAVAKVAQEDAEARLAAMQKQAQAAQQKQTEQQSRAQKDFMDFSNRYPGVNVKDIPQSVVQKAARGEMTLSAAYAEHLYTQLKAENQRLQQSLAAKQQNETNRQKTTGSMKTEGSQTAGDTWLAGFDSD